MNRYPHGKPNDEGTTHQSCTERYDNVEDKVTECCTCTHHGCTSDLSYVETPMGVSAWKAHGIKYGYDKFFKIKWPKE